MQHLLKQKNSAHHSFSRNNMIWQSTLSYHTSAKIQQNALILLNPERVYNHQKWAVISGYLTRGKSKPQLGYSYYILSNGEKYFEIQDFVLQRVGKSEGKRKEDYHRSFQNHTEFRERNPPELHEVKNSGSSICLHPDTSINLVKSYNVIISIYLLYIFL